MTGADFTIGSARGLGSDELRAAFRSGGHPGAGMPACADGEPAFTADEAGFLTAIGEQGRWWPAERAAAGPRPAAEPGYRRPGAGRAARRGLKAVSDDALRWLARMPDEGLELPSVVCEVAQRTRMLAHTARRCPPARARVRLPSQQWLLVHGARLHPVASDCPSPAVVLEPPAAHRPRAADRAGQQG